MNGEPTYEFDIPNGRTKLKELILHIAKECCDDPTFGATKLNKILWWADFLFYRATGLPITGVAYRKLANGPAPLEMVQVRDEMVDSKDAAIQEMDRFGHTQERLINLRQPNYDFFAPQEIPFCNDIIRQVKGKTASQVSIMSHGKAWQSVEELESIPYQTAYLSDEEITQADIVRTRELSRKLRW